jgi:hypothetical protein
MRVVLYGSSLFIEGLEESLKAVPALEVVRLRADANNLLQQARRVQPNAVVIESGALPDEFSIGLLKEFPGLLLVALDRETSHLLVLSGQQAPAVTTKDLVQVIENWHNSAPPPPHWQERLRRWSQFIAARAALLRASPRQQKLVFALAAIAVSAVLALVLWPLRPTTTSPLTGTAVGGPTSEVGLAFIGGIFLGALLLGLAHYYRRDKL